MSGRSYIEAVKQVGIERLIRSATQIVGESFPGFDKTRIVMADRRRAVVIGHFGDLNWSTMVNADPRDFDRADDAHDGAICRQLWAMIRGRA